MPLYDTSTPERAMLAQLVCGRAEAAAEASDSLQELARLADTAGMTVVGCMTQHRPRPDVATLFGAGKLADLRTACAERQANLVLFDNDLSSIQAANLNQALEMRVLDRTEVILQIFARRARSAEAQVQVELAQLEFLLARVPVLEAQQRFKGGIGMKGPGESHLQLRNAPMRRRIAELKRRLAAIQARQSRSHARRTWPVVSLVGYTNAGKSTLLNALSGADAYVDDRLFATLDTKTRLVRLGEGRRILLTDTVGFIRNLPHGLVASFRSTLDVAAQADLLLLVVDASHPRVQDHIAVCRATLEEIGAGGVPVLPVLNKCDLPGAAVTVAHAPERHPQAIPVSAHSGLGLDTLRLAIQEELKRCCTLWRLPSATSGT